MATANLTASARSTSGKGAARALRREGRVPAIVYGHAREPQSLSIPTRDLERLLDVIAAGSTVVELSIDGKPSRTLIREIQRHPFKKQILHVDFQELVAGEKITVSIPLVLVGIPEGVRLGGGILEQMMREIEVEVDPASIPNHIDVDVSHLVVGHSVHVSELQIPAGVTVLAEPDAPIALVQLSRASVEVPVIAEGEEVAGAEPELIRKPKEEGEGEEK
ncbi:MAG: 50S ribosomal protein L25 [Gemmatimonadaceae bacterium]|nr:50S ribosomal protein L25 [Gemmatimonadaceae bacterium]NUQ94960.1 50S ribosomal protein L25 [Gemmatimonadaceae bacterium]NUR18632.1 50S ribosomal protein L25 [Gemmatimonadaceae bacterium]